MRSLNWVLAVAVVSAGGFVSLWAQDSKQPPAMPDADAMKSMMEKAKKFTEPGEAHKALSRFLGNWDTETRFFMGGQASPPEKGTSETTWLIEGRWLKSQWRGTMMGMPNQGFMILGYDNFKMSYVTSVVSSMDTAMLHSEGDMDPGGKTLITYGTLDEYLSGEHDKMVKYVWRFESNDKIVMEIHDLPIGENNTKVIEITSTRRK
jgi:hypothetical protein